MIDNFRFFRILFFSILLSFIISCEENAPTSKPLLNFYETVAILKVEPEVDWSFITGRVTLLDRTIYNDSTKTEKNIKEVNGLFYTDVSNYVDGGGLKVYDRWVRMKSIEEIYGYKDPINELFSFGKGYNDTMSIIYGGNNIPFSLTGNSKFESFSLNVKCPTTKVRFTQPLDENEIDVSKDYLIKWKGEKDSTASIRISISNGSNKDLTYYGKDTGEHLLTKNYLEYLGKGKFHIEIISGNYAIQKLSNSLYALAIAGSSHQTTIYLK